MSVSSKEAFRLTLCRNLAKVAPLQIDPRACSRNWTSQRGSEKACGQRARDSSKSQRLGTSSLPWGPWTGLTNSTTSAPRWLKDPIHHQYPDSLAGRQKVTRSPDWLRNLCAYHRLTLILDSTHRYNISEPFDFQHLTHTDPSQFQKMQEASQYDIASEFSALRASQAPRRQLQGIKAQNLTCPEETLDGSSSPRPAAQIESPRSEASPRDKLQHSLYVPPSPTSTPDMSDEEIYLDRAAASGSTPPRISSPELDHFDDAYALLSRRTSQVLPHQPSMDYPIATWADGVYNFSLPHAMTTPDDVAQTLHAPPFHINRTELSQVLEEDEFVDGKRYSFVKPTNPSSMSSADFWYNKALSATKLSPPKSAFAPTALAFEEKQVSVNRPPSVFEQPAYDIPFRPHSRGPSSDAGEDMEASWEDDIDWCYEHAAEADCNFDWNRSSTVYGDPNGLLASFSERATHQLEQHLERKFPLRFTQSMPGSSSTYASVPSIMVPVQCDVPDLEPPSAISAQSSFDNVSEAVTPVQTSATDLNQHFLTAACKPTCQDWVDHASPLPTQNDHDSTMIFEDHFHVIYARKSLPEHNFPLGQVDGSTISSASPRSSRSPLSKSSSQESFWSRRDHRSNSGSSVPDLIQSKINSERRAYSGEQVVNTESLTTTNGEIVHPSTHHRRSHSLAKDVAQKNILTKVKNRDSGPVDGGSLPPPAAHNQGRHSPDATTRSVDMWSAPFPARPFPSRSRAGSHASSSGKKPSAVYLPYQAVDEAQA